VDRTDSSGKVWPWEIGSVTRFSLFPKRSHFGANESENKWETGKEGSTQGNQG